ncbi:MAG: hypothetical protein ACRDTF_21325 [Pseudonocardiaceae bacterium]
MAEPDIAVTSNNAASPTPDEGGPRRSRWSLSVLIGLTAVALVVILLGLFFGWRLIQADREEARREVVVQTARQAADNLTTIDYRTADRDVQQLLDGSTDEFAVQFGISGPAFLEVVKQTKLVSTSEITSAGIERVDERSARVLLAVKALVRDAATPQGTPRNYRMGMELVFTDGRWLVSSVEFIL